MIGGSFGVSCLNLQKCPEDDANDPVIKPSLQPSPSINSADTFKDKVFNEALSNTAKFDALRGQIDQLLIEGPEMDS